MNFSRVLLVFPEYKHTQYGATHPPVSLGYLSEVLKINGVEHDVVDMRLGYDAHRLKLKIQQVQPDLIGISMMTLLHRETYKLIEEVKKVFPEIAIVVGGPHVSTFRENTLRQCPAIDFGITQEGEMTLIELCQGVKYANIRGFIYRQNGQLIYTDDRPFIMDLDSLAFPKYEKFGLGKYITDEIPLLTSRGCPYKCIYCPVKTTIGRRFRARSSQHVAEEIQYWYEKGKRHFGIVDDNFMLIKERVLHLCQEIDNRRLRNLELRCPNGVRADQCDRELLIKMRNIGLKYLAIGVEAGNDKILQRINKGERIEVIRQAIENACSLGYEVILFFLIGSPSETRQDIEDSVNIALSYPVFDAKFYNLVPFPDTELFKWISENKYFIRDPKEYLNDASHWDAKPVFITPELSFEQRVKALNYTAKIRKQVRKRALQRKLKKLGILSKFLTNIFILDSVQYQLLHNRFLRRLSTYIFRIVAK
jgi:radical SAM superfamily enzyme YgiQ (UPF0313 family)